MENTRLAWLFERYLAQQMTAEELNELNGLLNSSEDDADLKQLLAEKWRGFNTVQTMPVEQADGLFQAVLQQASAVGDQPRKLVSIGTWRRIAAAAAVVLLIGAGAYFLFWGPAFNGSAIVKTNETATDVKPPQSSKATITLADGRTVLLDSLNAGTLLMQGDARLVKLADGQIVYQASQQNGASALAFNTLINPRGSKVIDLLLADGSRLWLNAGSSVTYPVNFPANERKVTITGEAYFEVKRDAARPFYVSKGGVQVNVLGTHFNVNAYDDEPAIKVTLLEGSVKVTDQESKREAVLQPGEQAVLHPAQLTVDDADTSAVMAWKNGKFVFGAGTDIQSIMRQLARWYDLQVEYNGGTIDTHFEGSVSRHVELSQVLKILEATGEVRITIQHNRVFVSPAK